MAAVSTKSNQELVVAPHTTGTDKREGAISGKKVIPVSHAVVHTGGISLSAIMFVLGIILWAVGACNGNPGMELAGKILFGLAVAPAILACCCGILFVGSTISSGRVM